MNPPSIRVKLLSRCPSSTWLRQLPTGHSTWGNCQFLFDPDERDYDWLIVYDELPRTQDPGSHPGYESLACSQKNTLLITTEPSSIKYYHRNYTGQFGWVLTSQAEWALPHPRRIYSQPALRWFYRAELPLSFEHLRSNLPNEKAKTISTVLSNKKQRHTLHHRRYHFIHDLKDRLPQLEIFGRGLRPVIDKSEALDSFKYHITIENFIGPHHWTEKLSDAFLGACLPFYAGCTNATDYFPPESFIPIDIHDTKEAEKIISKAIQNNEYEKRLPYIKEARRRVLEEYNLFAIVSKEIEARHSNEKATAATIKISGRKALRRNTSIAISDAYNRSTLRLKHWLRH